MSTRRLLSRAVLIPFLGGTTYVIAVYRQVSEIPSYNVSREDRIPSSFRNSKALQLVNPRNFTATGDAYSTKLEIAERHGDVSDETLLAWYLKGFFESRVFAPERTLLKTFRLKDFTKFSGLPSLEVETNLWATQDLPEQTLPPLHSRIFGIFQILGIHYAEKTKGDSRECLVDVGFGSDNGRFSGCHRLSIVRTSTEAQLHLACTSCNPTQDGRLNSGVLRSFHKFYASLLFRAAVARVKERVETS